jgi:hypothetical protein
MGKLSKALGYDLGEGAPASDTMGMSESTGDAPVDDKPKGTATAEVLAMKQFDRATTPEARAQALKDFLEACGLY